MRACFVAVGAAASMLFLLVLAEAPPPPPLAPVPHVHLVEWARRVLHVELNGITVAQTKHGRGLVTTRRLRKGEIVLKQPSATVLRHEYVAASPIGAPLSVAMGNIPLATLPSDNFLPIITFLLYHASTPTSQWKTYLNSLPPCTPHPLTFTPAELALLKGSESLTQVLRLKQLLKRAHAILTHLATRHPAILPPRVVTREACTLWLCQFMMRGYGPIGTSGAASSIVMLPGIDYGNHWPGGAEPLYNATSREYMLLAPRDMKAGEEFFTFYGELDTIAMLVSFGIPPQGRLLLRFSVDWAAERAYLKERRARGSIGGDGGRDLKDDDDVKEKGGFSIGKSSFNDQNNDDLTEFCHFDAVDGVVEGRFLINERGPEETFWSCWRLLHTTASAPSCEETARGAREYFQRRLDAYPSSIPHTGPSISSAALRLSQTTLQHERYAFEHAALVATRRMRACVAPG